VIDIDSDAYLADLIELVGDVVALVVDDCAAAQAECRDPLSLWQMLGANPHAMALGERLLEQAQTRLETEGEA
jgi:hypothetical protein